MTSYAKANFSDRINFLNLLKGRITSRQFSSQLIEEAKVDPNILSSWLVYSPPEWKGSTLYHIAARCNDALALETFLNINPSGADILDSSKMTPLHIAAMYGSSKEVVETICQFAPSITKKDPAHYVAIHWALSLPEKVQDKENILQAFIDCGFDI